MKQSQFYYLLRRGLFSAGSAIIKNGLVMFNKFTTAGISHPAQGSAEFNGSSDYITAPVVPMPSGGSLLFWYNSTASEYAKDVFSTGSSTNDFRILFNSLVGFYTGAEYRIQSNGLWNTSGEWDHFALTWDSSGTKLFFLGSQKASNGTAPADYSIVPPIIYFGAKYNNTNFWNGNLANVAIWNRALSSDEINSVMWKSYEALSGTESNGLKAWYSLDDITSPAASLANMQQLATDKNATIENTAAITAAINSLS